MREGVSIIEQQYIGDREFNIGYIGGLSINKGRELFYKLANSHILRGKVKFIVFGITDLHKEPGYYSSENIHIYGKYKNIDELQKIILTEKIDLFILPAIWPETFSFTLSEAWALGIPVFLYLGLSTERKG